MNYSFQAIVIFLSLSLAGYSQADETDTTEIETTLVTATRMAMRADDSLASVIVIDRDQIERSLAADVAELLRFHAGLELGRNGGPGQTTSLFLRGTESNHTLVMVDGVRINPGTIGAAALQNISPRLIERIEVVKGPRSSLYGSDAIGGVINIITRKTDGMEMRLGGGRYDTREASVSAGIANETGALSASLSDTRSDGFPTRVGADLPDRGYDNQSIGLNASLTMDQSTLSFRHWQSSGNTEYLDFLLEPVDQDYSNRASAIELAGQFSSAWDSKLTLSDITDDIEQRQSPDFAKTERMTLDWQNNLAVSDRHTVVAGLYLAREKTRAESFGALLDEKTDVDAVYVEDYIDISPGQLLLAARYTDHEAFGANTTWNIEYGHRFDSGWRLTAAAGTGFRAPDATDRFGFGGNELLEAEDSRNLEIGADRRFGEAHVLRLSVFQNDIDNLIEFVFDPDNFAASENRNVAKTRITGLEASYGWHNSDWELGVTALLQDPEDKQTGEQLARRARRSLTINTVRRFDQFNIGLDLLASSSRPDSAFSDTVNAGYLLANLNSQWQISRHWSLQGRIENLLDRDYETAAGFRSPGRGLYLTAQYRDR